MIQTYAEIILVKNGADSFVISGEMESSELELSSLEEYWECEILIRPIRKFTDDRTYSINDPHRNFHEFRYRKEKGLAEETPRNLVG
jgi:hypothetical protein